VCDTNEEEEEEVRLLLCACQSPLSLFYAANKTQKLFILAGVKGPIRLYQCLKKKAVYS
jgi:hypothetical protein